MAIYPVTNAYVVNKDAVVGSPFKSGMILMSNSEGKVIPADSQLLAIKNISQKQAAIIGVAAGDYNISGNTIIVPDYIGSNYLDANSNFVSASDREYLSIRRQLLDYADETVNEYYNINYSPKPSRTGIGVYSLLGESFITDQFSPVLHGDYGIDGTVIQSLNPGDLLTFGGGINAGKLVKVNANSFGPDVLVVGIVDRYVTNTGLLHFRQVSYSLSFGTNPYVLAIDAGNAVSYANGSSTTTNLVNGTTGGTLVNGTSYSSVSSGAWVFDGVNDYINTSFNSAPFTTNATILMWIQLDSNTPVAGNTGLLGFRPGFVGATHYPWVDSAGYFTTFRTSRVNTITLSPLDKSTIHLLSITTDSVDWKLYQNTTLVNTSTATILNLSEPWIGTSDATIVYNLKGKIFQFNLLNQALTATQITNYYNLTKGRYGV
jgi:urease beta subunit